MFWVLLWSPEWVIDALLQWFWEDDLSWKSSFKNCLLYSGRLSLSNIQIFWGSETLKCDKYAKNKKWGLRLRQIVWPSVYKVFLLCSSSIRHSFQILIHRLFFFKSPALTFIFRTSSLTCYKHRGIMEQKAGENSPSFIPSLPPVVAHVQRTEVRAGEGWWDVPHRTSAMCSFHQRRQQRPHHTG